MYKKTNDKNLAEEFSVETFAKAFDNLDSYNEKFTFKSWLFTIAKNHQIDQFRKTSNINKNTSNINDPSNSELMSLSLNPEDQLVTSQNIEAILRHIKSLKKDYRIILKLKYFEGMSYKEMEKELNLPINTLKVKLFRAKKILTQLIFQVV